MKTCDIHQTKLWARVGDSNTLSQRRPMFQHWKLHVLKHIPNFFILRLKYPKL